MKFFRIALFILLFYPAAASAQVRVIWDWDSFDIVENDRIGSGYNAHTVREHVGKDQAYLANRAATKNLQCTSSFWTTADANHWIRSTLKEEDRLRQSFGWPSIFDELMSYGEYSFGKIIVRAFDFDPSIRWIYGTYVRDYGTVYGANGTRIVLKRVPNNVGPGFIVETAFPEIDPAYSRICG
ncbi:MAG TPA: RNase A-like domain-containing protein [Allosphingosinicella sp.]|jgi:hypothetical protein